MHVGIVIILRHVHTARGDAEHLINEAFVGQLSAHGGDKVDLAVEKEDHVDCRRASPALRTLALLAEGSDHGSDRTSSLAFATDKRDGAGELLQAVKRAGGRTKWAGVTVEVRFFEEAGRLERDNVGFKRDKVESQVGELKRGESAFALKGALNRSCAVRNKGGDDASVAGRFAHELSDGVAELEARAGKEDHGFHGVRGKGEAEAVQLCDAMIFQRLRSSDMCEAAATVSVHNECRLAARNRHQAEQCLERLFAHPLQVHSAAAQVCQVRHSVMQLLREL
jgi:hypothetical protein